MVGHRDRGHGGADRRAGARALVGVGVAAWLAGCAGGGLEGRLAGQVRDGALPAALDAWEAAERPPEGLRAIAAALLEREALGDDAARRRAALGQLVLAGDDGAPVLERLSRPEVPDRVRAAALARRARRGDRGARAALRPYLDSDDQALVAAGALALDAGDGDDRARLLGLLRHPSEGARAVAARALRGAAPDADVRRALADAARRDPHPPARAAAVRSLGAWGVEAVDVLAERLSDPRTSVRLAAVGALVDADRPAAAARLGASFAAPPGPVGVEAARRLLATAPDDRPDEVSRDARTYLRGALRAGNPTVRAQAGVALASLGREVTALADAVARALEVEPDAEVRLALAAALFRGERHRAAGREALVALLDADAGNATVQAASLLARASPEAERPLATLRAALADGDAGERRVAARALAVDAGRPDLAAAALRDDDPTVRVAAAGAILAAA